MSENRSFSAEEGRIVKQAILQWVRDSGPLSNAELQELVTKYFPTVDSASTVYHLTRDLAAEGLIQSSVLYHASK